MNRLSSWMPWLSCLALVGCKPPEPIESYRVIKQAELDREFGGPVAGKSPSSPHGAPASASVESRMLGAMARLGDRAWFFKLTGPKATVGEQKEAFVSFLESLKLPEGEEAKTEWSLPAGWQAEPGGGMRLATLKIASDPPLEVSVTMLTVAGLDDDSYALANINRWRNQLQLPPITTEQLPQETSPIKLAAGTALLVDLLGMSSGAPMGGPMQGMLGGGPLMKPEPPAQAASGATSKPGKGQDRMLGAILSRGNMAWFFKLTGPKGEVAAQNENFEGLIKSIELPDADADRPRWQLPAGWQELPGGGMRLATIMVPGNPKPLELSVIRLPKLDPDDQAYNLANINRWRGQLQLPPIEAGELAAQTKQISVAGSTATLVDLVGTAAAGGGPMQGGPFMQGTGNGK